MDTQDAVKDMLWSHPYSIKLLNSFPTMLIFDITYKMNKYILLLLEIEGHVVHLEKVNRK